MRLMTIHNGSKQTISTIVGLGCYKWYQNQSLSCVSTRILSLKREWIVRLYIVWRQEQVPSRTLGLEGRWIMRFYVDWREKQVPTRTLSYEKGELWDSISVEENNETFFTRVKPTFGKPSNYQKKKVVMIR